MFNAILGSLTTSLWVAVAIGLLALIVALSIHKIGPTEVGLVTKRFSWSKLSDGNVIAFRGEAGYQSDLLMPGLRFKLWPLFGVGKRPLVQVPAGQIGVVIAQAGAAPPTGAKSVEYKREFGNFSDLRAFVQHGGRKGTHPPARPPRTGAPPPPPGT